MCEDHATAEKYIPLFPQSQPHIYVLFTVFAEAQKQTTIHSTLFPMGPVHIYAMRFFGKVQGLFYKQGATFLAPKTSMEVHENAFLVGFCV